jgi:hypothetical protein
VRLRGEGPAPAERLAAFRIALGVFIAGYLTIRIGVFVELGARSPSRFEPVGIFRLIDEPLGGLVNDMALAAALLLGIAFTAGWRFRIGGPLFALALLVVTSHRSSWGQLLHFENLMVLQAFVVGFSPAADAWSADARRAAVSDRPIDTSPVGDRYGFALLAASVIVVVTYVIAGIAKLRYGGLEWAAGDTLRNHIAYSATRLELLGGWASPAARWAIDASWVLPPMAALSVLIELAAPLALLGGRWRNTWVSAAWLMHVGIYALMLVGFPSPLFLIAFAPMFPLERLVQRFETLSAGRLRWRG